MTERYCANCNIIKKIDYFFWRLMTEPDNREALLYIIFLIILFPTLAFIFCRVKESKFIKNGFVKNFLLTFLVEAILFVIGLAILIFLNNGSCISWGYCGHPFAPESSIIKLEAFIARITLVPIIIYIFLPILIILPALAFLFNNFLSKNQKK